MAIPEARIKRLRWRCRRGMLELDALLQGWLDLHAASMDGAQFEAFDTLLERQDPELWEWLAGRARPPRNDWCPIVDEIRRHASLAP